MNITLTELSCKYGAPMGRHPEGHPTLAHSFALEWMPFVDDCYDAGTASQEVTCHDCNASWLDLYQLTGYQEQ